MDKRILITGSSGFIGRSFVSYLSKHTDYQIVCYDLRKNPDLSNSIKQVDSSFFKVAQPIDVIVHLAYSGYPTYGVSSIKDDIDKNVIQAIDLLDFSIKAKVKKFIFMSSGGAVYGNLKKDRFSEEDNTNPISSYGITKLLIEKYLRLYHETYGLNTCSIRLSNPYSSLFDPSRNQGIIPIFCYNILNKKTITIFGDGENLRDYIYIDDVVDAIQKIIDYKEYLNEINIGSGIGTSINQIIKIIESNLGIQAIIQKIPPRGCDVRRNILDTSKAKSVLDWSSKINVEDGIKKILQEMIG